MLAAIESDPKRIYYPASYSLPFIPADAKHGAPLDAPMHALDARQTGFGSYSGQSCYSSSDRRDLGERSSAPRPSLLAELLQDLDPRYMSFPHSSEVKPLSLAIPVDDTKNRQGVQMPPRYPLGENWYLRREQAATTPLNPIFVF